jgi:DNA-binding CsgD family transcriptional regulator
MEQQLANDWVARRILPAETVEGLRNAVMQDLMATAEADHGMYHSVVVIDGEICFHDVQTFGEPGRMDYLRDCSGRPLTDYADVSPSVMTALNQFTEVTIDEFRSNRGYETMWVPMQCVSVLAMSAVVDGALVGWVGAHRVEGQPFFGPKIVRAVQARADAYIHCLEVARRLEGEASQTRGLLLLTEKGEVAFSCATGRRWLERSGLLARLREVLASPESPGTFSAHGAIVRLTPVTGALGSLYCAEIVAAETWRVPEIVGLSVQKRRVAELAALGATAPEIGKSLGISAWTVRAHLKQIYAALGISTRLELAERVQALYNPSS